MTNERKRVPDTFGRLYADDTPVGGTLGTWVRRAEVDSLLDEIEGAHHDIDRLMAACTAEANEVERLRADISQAYDLRDKAEGRYCTALMEIDRLRNIVTGCPVCSELERNIRPSPEPGACAPRESDWCCTHCGRDNDPSETHCVHCEWSRRHTIAGVLHERGCGDNPCRCGAAKSQGASRDASSEPCEQLDAGKTKLAIAMLDRFCDGRLQTAEGTHTSLLGPRDQLLQEADWFDHAAKVLRSSLR